MVFTSDVQSIFFNAASSLDVQGVSLPPPEVYRRMGCGVPSPTVFCLNAVMPDCPEFGQSGTGIRNNADTGASPVPE